MMGNRLTNIHAILKTTATAVGQRRLLSNSHEIHRTPYTWRLQNEIASQGQQGILSVIDGEIRSGCWVGRDAGGTELIPTSVRSMGFIRWWLWRGVRQMTGILILRCQRRVYGVNPGSPRSSTSCDPQYTRSCAADNEDRSRED